MVVSGWPVNPFTEYSIPGSEYFSNLFRVPAESKWRAIQTFEGTALPDLSTSPHGRFNYCDRMLCVLPWAVPFAI